MNLSRQTFGILLAVPAIGWLTVFFLIPLLIIVVYSFGVRPEDGGIALGLSLENYRSMADASQMIVLWRTIRLSVLNAVICAVLGVPLAWYLAFDVVGRKKQILLLAIIVPFWLTLLVRIYSFFALLRPGGLISRAITSLGISETPPQLLFNEGSTIIGMVFSYLPLMVLPTFVSLDRLAKSQLMRVAEDLGAPPIRALLTVAGPLASPGILTGLIMVFLPSLGAYIVPTLMGGGKTQLLGNLIAENFLTYRDYAQGAALAVVLLVAIGLTLPALLRSMDQDFRI